MADEAKKQESPEAAAVPPAPERADAAAQPAADAAAPEGAEKKGEPVRKVRGGLRSVPFGIANIVASFNNTMVTITDAKGNVISWSSSGRAGFKGSRKSTAFAATVVGQEAARGAVSRGMHEVEVRIQGPGAGRESAIRALQTSGLNVSVIRDVTPMPHNGCRARKRRRV